MRFSNWAELIYMQGHGVFVWSAYGIFILSFVIFIWVAAQQHRRWLTQQQRQIKRQSTIINATTSSEPLCTPIEKSV
jgi:heme exporter protein D